MKTVKKKKYTLKKWVLVVLLFTFLGFLAYSGYNILIWKLDNNKSEKIVKDLTGDVKITEVNDDDAEIINEETIYWSYIKMPFISVDFDNLLTLNKDTVAWINVPGTIINYPVVQKDNNDYYLSHDFNKEHNTGGWIFLDYRNDLNNLKKNNIIYGHNRKDTTMFGSLKNVLKSAWLKNRDNHVVKISTPKYNYLFEVFSVYSIPTESYYITTDFKTDNDFQTFLDTLVGRSIYDFNSKVNTDDTIITLSTCYNNDKKTVLHAKLIKKSER